MTCLRAGPAAAQDAAAPPPPDAAAATAPPAGPAPLDERVIATVNDDVISTYDLGQRIRLLIVTAGIQPTNDNMPQLEREALSSLIDERLELQELKREEKQQKFSIIATDADIDDEIANIAKNNNTTPQQLLASLAQQGVGAKTFRDQLRAEISWQRWIRGRYGSRLKIGEDQIKAFEAREAAEADKPRYQVSEVLIDPQRAGGEAPAMKEANQLVAQIHQGAPFSAVARQFSADSTAANGGDAGWVTAGEFPPQVDAALQQMRPSQLSAPIPTKDGIYIIYLRNKAAGANTLLISLMQAAVPLAANASQAQVDAATAKLEGLRARLHGCTNFLAIAGKVDGIVAGDLGEAEAKDLAPAFRTAALAMNVGDVSQPLRSDEGLHLIAVCNKRTNAAQGMDHDQIENLLFGRQLSMISRRYVRDLRNSADIETR
ncbi:MAG TPA: peptidylprolyl isomerase [Caulobacteraceae bacterium]|nr:peptidylprolyl isomerase [Caulobacteraceae bacterium]